MTNHEFRSIRLRLGFTQEGLAAFLGYSHTIRISEFERDVLPVLSAPIS